jgi:hypothetical protein
MNHLPKGARFQKCKYIISEYMVEYCFLMEKPSPDMWDAAFEEALSALDITCLEQSGFGHIDPRNPYDWP